MSVWPRPWLRAVGAFVGIRRFHGPSADGRGGSAENPPLIPLAVFMFPARRFRWTSARSPTGIMADRTTPPNNEMIEGQDLRISSSILDLYMGSLMVLTQETEGS